MIGRWLELRFVTAMTSNSKAMWKEAVDRSGEMGSLREETRVGKSRLRRERSEFVTASVIRVPLASASVYVV